MHPIKFSYFNPPQRRKGKLYAWLRHSARFLHRGRATCLPRSTILGSRNPSAAVGAAAGAGADEQPRAAVADAGVRPAPRAPQVGGAARAAVLVSWYAVPRLVARAAVVSQAQTTAAASAPIGSVIQRWRGREK